VAIVETLPEPALRSPPDPFRREGATTDARLSRRQSLSVPRPWVCWLFLTVWCGGLFFYGLNAGQLWKTEGLRAIVAAEYLRTGNWIVPTLYGEPLFTKPPGMYAAIALFSLPFGQVTEWTARLPSALAATITVLLLFGYFTRILGRTGGLVIAVLAPMAPLWLDKATAAEIDMMQVMWVTGSILCLLRAIELVRCPESGVRSQEGRVVTARESVVTVEHENSNVQIRLSEIRIGTPDSGLRTPDGFDTGNRTPDRFVWWLAALLCVAGGVLTKWTAPAFFYATVVPLLWWRGQLRQLFGWRHLAAAGIGASVCLAWIAAAVTLTGWEVFFETVKREALQRMLPDFAPKPDPWYVSALHPLVLWYNNLPWSLVALVACRPSFGRLWDERGRLLWQALHCWIWPNVLIWSLMLDHKPRHSFPLFPAFAGLAAMVWLAWLRGSLPWRFRVKPQRVLIAAAICWMATKLVFVHYHVSTRYLSRDPRGKAAIIAALVPQGAILYLFQLKDEGIMFYYGRIVRRLQRPDQLPSSTEPLYCILAKEEWKRWQETSNRVAVPLTDSGFTDEQGDPMMLVRIQ
jgi:4-amino-4-deoxy-L-arabinose transferase-like glycosyltransferase